jgi:hypothetical protein
LLRFCELSVHTKQVYSNPRAALSATPIFAVAG